MIQKLGIVHETTFTYHPEANGLLEGQHKKIKENIRALDELTNWQDFISVIVLGWNNALASNNPFTPSQQLFGTELRLPGELFEDYLEEREIGNDLSYTQKFNNLMKSIPSFVNQ